MFSAIIISNIFSVLFSLSSPNGIPIKNILHILKLLHSSWMFYSVLFIQFSLCTDVLEIPINLSLGSLILSSDVFNLLMSPSKSVFISASVYFFLIFSFDALLESSSLWLYYSFLVAYCFILIRFLNILILFLNLPYDNFNI